MAMKQRHELDQRGAFEFGNEAEEQFSALANGCEGYTCEPGSQEEDFNHIDFWLTTPDGQRLSVDVKAMKRVSAGDQKQQDAQVWIELRNVKGDLGWCFSEVDVIAFEFQEAFFMVQRAKLAAWVVENVSTEVVDRASLAICKVYSRNGRDDKITLLQSYWIRALADGMLRKNGTMETK